LLRRYLGGRRNPGLRLGNPPRTRACRTGRVAGDPRGRGGPRRSSAGGAHRPQVGRMNTGIMGEAPVPPRGVTGWLEPGDYEAAERFLADCRACHAAWLRLPVTVQQWHDQTSRAWLSWLAERAAAEFELIVALYREFPSGAALAPVCV